MRLQRNARVSAELPQLQGSRHGRGLRKIPYVDGAYSASGTLAGIEGPGRRIVTRLELRRLAPDADLSILAAFTDLETLELERVQGIDLAPLAGLRSRG